MLSKYVQNLEVIENKVYSYNTEVAIIDTDKRTLKELGKWSQTTSKHVNYVAKELGLTKISA